MSEKGNMKCKGYKKPVLMRITVLVVVVAVFLCGVTMGQPVSAVSGSGKTQVSTSKAKSKTTKTSKKKYVPISKGWKTSKSTKGDITSSQKADIDAMIVHWKAKEITDDELKTQIEQYLQEQKIDYMEVYATSKGYSLYKKIPKPYVSDSNLYTFFGTYCTGKKNPDGTNKTVCYNWSVFVF